MCTSGDGGKGWEGPWVGVWGLRGWWGRCTFGGAGGPWVKAGYVHLGVHSRELCVITDTSDMLTELKIEAAVLAEEYDLLHIKLYARNPNIELSTTCYAALSEIKSFGQSLVQFPVSVNHKPHHTFDSQGLESPYSLSLKCFCYNHQGHSVLEVELIDKRPPPNTYQAKLQLKTHPGEINQLGKDLIKWAPATNDLVWKPKLNKYVVQHCLHAHAG